MSKKNLMDHHLNWDWFLWTDTAKKILPFFIFIVKILIFFYLLYFSLFTVIDWKLKFLISRTATKELTVNNKNLQIIGIVDHLANKWGSEDELGEKQSRKMASRNTQNQCQWKVWKYEGASSNMRSLMRENFA